MAECSRIDTEVADQKKSDFIGSISHELRSPLHGILASSEFLGDEVTTGFAKGLVETIDSCGRTLLDTIVSSCCALETPYCSFLLDYSNQSVLGNRYVLLTEPSHLSTQLLDFIVTSGVYLFQIPATYVQPTDSHSCRIIFLISRRSITLRRRGERTSAEVDRFLDRATECKVYGHRTYP